MNDEHRSDDRPATAPVEEPAGVGELAQYFLANRGRFTDDALMAQARRQGHSEATIQAALAQSGMGGEGEVAIRGRAFRWTLALYLGTYAVLDLGMLLNGRPAGYLMPDATGGIVILTASLVAAFVLSLIWISSRWAFGILFFAAMVVFGLPTIVMSIIGVAGLFWLIRTRDRARRTMALEVALVVPVLMLLGIGGICVASGLPIPGVGAR